MIEEMSPEDAAEMINGAAKPQPINMEKLCDIEKLFVYMTKTGASDLLIKAGQKPVVRIGGVMQEVGNKRLTPTETQKVIYDIMSEEQRQEFQKNLDIDFAHGMSGVGRFRLNVFHDRGSVAASVRRINTRIPTFDELHLPDIVRKLASAQQGLIVVSGPTGSGKSSTLACMIDYINQTRKCHIITIEDPIEYLFKDSKSFISQREVGIDVESFKKALKYVVRQDPDVILIGEMRDVESVEAALMASETGHLVLGTIHASNAPQTMSRILDLFPSDRQTIIRQSLSFNLKAILCQRLIASSKDGVSMTPMVESLVVTPLVQKMIQGSEDRKLSDVMRASENEGMQDFNQSLIKLINMGLISKKTAMTQSPNPEQLKMNLQGIFLDSERGIVG